MKCTFRTVKILLFSISILILTGCSCCNREYPRVEYQNSIYRFDPYYRGITVESGYVLDDGHPYDIVDTDIGYDIVLHFVEKQEETHE